MWSLIIRLILISLSPSHNSSRFIRVIENLHFILSSSSKEGQQVPDILLVFLTRNYILVWVSLLVFNL